MAGIAFPQGWNSEDQTEDWNPQRQKDGERTVLRPSSILVVDFRLAALAQLLLILCLITAAQSERSSRNHDLAHTQ